MSNYLSKIRDFVQGNYNFFNRQHNDIHINEQAQWRAYLCHECLKAGKCRICHCKTPNMFYSPNKVDAANKWGKMLSRKEWETFKNTNAEYKIFLRHLKDQEKLNNAGNQLYEQQQKLLGYTPPINDPIPEYYQKGREEEVFGSAVGDSPDSPLKITVLQPPVRTEEEGGEGGLPGTGGVTYQVQLSGDFIPGRDDDTGTKAANDMEKEDRREESAN